MASNSEMSDAPETSPEEAPTNWSLALNIRGLRRTRLLARNNGAHLSGVGDDGGDGGGDDGGGGDGGGGDGGDGDGDGGGDGGGGDS